MNQTKFKVQQARPAETKFTGGMKEKLVYVEGGIVTGVNATEKEELEAEGFRVFEMRTPSNSSNPLYLWGR